MTLSPLWFEFEDQWSESLLCISSSIKKQDLRVSQKQSCLVITLSQPSISDFFDIPSLISNYMSIERKWPMVTEWLVFTGRSGSPWSCCIFRPCSSMGVKLVTHMQWFAYMHTARCMILNYIDHSPIKRNKLMCFQLGCADIAINVGCSVAQYNQIARADGMSLLLLWKIWRRIPW